MRADHGVSWADVVSARYDWLVDAARRGAIAPASAQLVDTLGREVRALHRARRVPALSVRVGIVRERLEDSVWASLLAPFVEVFVGSGDLHGAIVAERALFTSRKWDILMCHDAYVAVRGPETTRWRIFAAYHYRRRIELMEEGDATCARACPAVQAVLASTSRNE